MALAAREAKDKGDGALMEALEPLEAIAANIIDPSQLDALCMLVTRRLQQARWRKPRSTR